MEPRWNKILNLVNMTTFGILDFVMRQWWLWLSFKNMSYKQNNVFVMGFLFQFQNWTLFLRHLSTLHWLAVPCLWGKYLFQVNDYSNWSAFHFMVPGNCCTLRPSDERRRLLFDLKFIISNACMRDVEMVGCVRLTDTVECIGPNLKWVDFIPFWTC